MPLQLHTFLAQAANFGGGFEPPTNSFSVASKESTVGALSNLETAISTIIGILTLIGSLMFILYFLLAALTWISSAGDKGKVTKARDQMTQAAIGLALIIMAYGAIGLIGSVLGLRLLEPGTVILKYLNPTKNTYGIQ